MRFSVIIPSKDGAARIMTPLDTIRRQTFEDYEIIVSCDSCTDNTRQIAESAGAKTLEVNCRSPGLAKNPALDIARGDYILFCNDDDWYTHNQAFEILDAKLRETEADILCFGFIMGRLGYRGPLDNGGYLFPGETLKAWRREAIGVTRFIRDPINQDVVFTQEMLAKNLRVALLDAPLYYHDWMRPGSITEVASHGPD